MDFQKPEVRKKSGVGPRRGGMLEEGKGEGKSVFTKVNNIETAMRKERVGKRPRVTFLAAGEGE